MGIAATAGAKAFSHTFSLVLTLALLTNLAQYTAWKRSLLRRYGEPFMLGQGIYSMCLSFVHILLDMLVSCSSGNLWQRQGPTILLLIAIPLICADQVRHCLQGW